MIRAILNLLFGHEEPELVESLWEAERRERFKAMAEDAKPWEWPWRAR